MSRRCSGSPASRRVGDRGAATVLAVGLLGLLVLLGCALAVVGAMLTAHRTAQAAADLAALAAAGAAGTGEPCSVAGRVAEANGARLVTCTVDGRDVRLSVVVTGPRWRGLVIGDLVAESRAGPAVPSE